MALECAWQPLCIGYDFATKLTLKACIERSSGRCVAEDSHVIENVECCIERFAKAMPRARQSACTATRTSRALTAANHQHQNDGK